MPLNNFGVVLPNKLYRCGQPDRAGFADLMAIGVTLVMKLNGDNEYPIGRERQEFPGGVLLASISTFHPDIDGVLQAAKVLQEVIESWRVVVHCMHGRDRTGLVIGAWRLRFCGWTLDQVNDERAVYGTAGIVKLATHEMDECLQAIAVMSQTEGR
jgi:hypothetical protein